MRYYIYISFIIIFLLTCSLAANQVDYSKLYRSRLVKSQYEIGEITFKGNAKYSSSQLETIISSRATNRSLGYNFYEFTYRNMKNSRIVPQFVKNDFRKKLNDLQTNIFFFNEEQINNDINSLRQYYHQNGNHQLKISYEFKPLVSKRINELIFILDEGQDFLVNGIDINFSDSISPILEEKVKSEMLLKPNAKFNENLVIFSADRMQNLLQNSGYYFASYNLPQVLINNETKTDSVILNISPGLKYRINSISFDHDTKGQKKLAAKMTEIQLEIQPGEYYDRSKLRTTESNFLSLNLFQVAKVDTLALNEADTSMDLVVRLKYRKQQEYNIGLFTNQTSFDKYVNAGAEATYTHRNIFGAAQVFNSFARFTLIDLSRFFINSKRDIEYQVGSSISQPIIWTIDKARVGGSVQLTYSYRRVIDDLWLSTFDLPFRFNVKLPRWTLFNNAFLDIGFSRQVPANFDEAFNNSMKYAKNINDTLNIIRKYLPFEEYNRFVNTEQPILTSTTFSLGLTGDTRNDLFVPNKGYFLSLLFDVAPFSVNKYTGISRFIRIQALYSQYIGLSYQSILAYKIKLGHIIWLEQDKSIVPYDLQFYAGGANSNRGWASRRLRYYGLEGFEQESGANFEFLEDYIGSASIIEGSIEYRYKIAGIGHRTLMQELLKDMQLAAFLDFGNAYQWFLFNGKTGYPNYKPQLKEYFKGIAVGAGFGIRYESPVGVVRLDFGWKIYDPNHFIDPKISKIARLKDVKLHIGLGYPF